MSGNSNKKNGKTNSKSSSNKKPKTYSGVVKSPQTKKVTGKVYIKEDSEDNGIKYGTILLIAVLAGIAALITPLGTALTDQFNYAGQSALFPVKMFKTCMRHFMYERVKS